MSFCLVELYTCMKLKKAFNFLKSLPYKLNRFYIKKLKSKIIVKNKSKNKKIYDPVTNLDQVFEKYIRSLIVKNFPYDSIIGEEFKKKNSSNYYTWSVDPIDGTKAFVIGAPTWSNLISLSCQENSLIGLVNFPELNKYYISDKKKSHVFKNKKRYILKTSKNINLNTIKVISHGNINYENLKKINKQFGPQFKIASFDALNFCLLAEGKVDAVVEGNLKPYDILPLIPIIKNAGGVISNWKGEPAEKAGNIIASSNRKLHNKILKLLKPFTRN